MAKSEPQENGEDDRPARRRDRGDRADRGDRGGERGDRDRGEELSGPAAVNACCCSCWHESEAGAGAIVKIAEQLFLKQWSLVAIQAATGIL